MIVLFGLIALIFVLCIVHMCYKDVFDKQCCVNNDK